MPIASLGVDLGSTTAKIVGVDARGELVWHLIEPTDPRMEGQATRFVEAGLAQVGGRVPVIATGYGRKLVKQADRKLTEITAHAMGVWRALGQAGTLIDIGGQDSKVIVIDGRGGVTSFAMNDKCAAGTGRFLEVVAGRLRLDQDGLSAAALHGEAESATSSTCTVFAESEIISLLARGEELEPIVRGMVRSLVKRVAALARGAGIRPPVMMSGGVARSQGVRALLAEQLGQESRVPEHPQLMGAYGAALKGLG